MQVPWENTPPLVIGAALVRTHLRAAPFDFSGFGATEGRSLVRFVAVPLHKTLHKFEPTLPNEANGCRLPHV